MIRTAEKSSVAVFRPGMVNSAAEALLLRGLGKFRSPGWSCLSF